MPRTTQLELGFDPDPMHELPLVYVASALSHLSRTDRQLLDAWCEVISTATIEATAGAEVPWDVRLHAPIQWSAPWLGDRLESAAIYEMNARLVREASAVFVLGYAGGSLGSGQELAWATALQTPVLLLTPRDDPISRQIQGTPADIEVAQFEKAAQLRELVSDYLRKRRHSINNHHQRIQSWRVMYTPTCHALADALADVPESKRHELSATSRLEARINELVSEPLALAGASMSELVALSSALRVDLAVTMSGRLPELNSREEEVLASTASEMDWTPDETLALARSARLERARGGIRRLPLESREGWLRLKGDLRL
jgi:hypothetical protein